MRIDLWYFLRVHCTENDVILLNQTLTFFLSPINFQAAENLIFFLSQKLNSAIPNKPDKISSHARRETKFQSRHLCLRLRHICSFCVLAFLAMCDREIEYFFWHDTSLSSPARNLNGKIYALKNSCLDVITVFRTAIRWLACGSLQSLLYGCNLTHN